MVRDMTEKRRQSLEEAKLFWRQEIEHAPRLTRSWLRAAVPQLMNGRENDEGQALRFALGLGLSALVSATVFVSGGSMYKAYWQSRLDFSSLVQTYTTVLPFEDRK